MYVNLIDNSNKDLKAKFVNEKVGGIFATNEGYIYTYEFRNGTCIDGQTFESAIILKRLLTNGVISEIDMPGHSSMCQVLTYELIPGLFSMTKKFSVGDIVLRVKSEYYPDRESSVPYCITVMNGAIAILNVDLKVTKVYDNNTYEISPLSGGHTIKILGGLICHKMTVVPFLV